MATISVQALSTRDPSTYVFIDVREPNEVASTPYSGLKVHHIPMNDIPAKLNEIPTDTTIIVGCRSGKRSAQVCDFLIEKGYHDVRNLTGGVLAWQSL